MVKLRLPLFSFRAKGRLGDISLARRNRINVAEKTPVVPDRKSPGQLAWRHMYQKATALWHALSAAEKQDWESQARPKHMTGFAWFMSQALKPNPGLYLPLQGGTMQGDIDMAKNRLLKLPLPVDDQEPVTKKYFEDNLPVGGYTEGARVYHGVNQSIPDSTYTILAFNSERYDTDVIHDNVTNNSRLTCKTAGKYVIMAGLAFYQNATGYRHISIYLSGTTTIAVLRIINLGPGVAPIFTVGTIYYLAVNSYVEVRVFQNSGGALVVSRFPDHSPEFMMQRVG